MASSNFGPFALSVSPVLALISVIIGFIVTLIVARKYKGRASDVMLTMLLAGLVLGRLVFVLRFFDSYNSFWHMLDIRDGDLDYTGALVGFAFVLFVKLRQGKQRRALLSGTFTMLGTYAAFSLVITLARSHTVLPQSTFMQLNGQEITIRDISQQKPVVVNLWATSCDPCLQEMPVLMAAEQRYNDVTFISLNQREASQTVAQFLQREGINFQHVLIDTKGEIATNKGLFSLPVTLFFDVNGKLVYSHTGRISQADLERGIEGYLR